MKKMRFCSILVVVLLPLAALNAIQSAPVPRDKPAIRLAQASKVKLADLTVNDAAVIDDRTIVVVGREGDIDKVANGGALPALDEGEPKGAIIDLDKKSARPFTNEHTKQIWGVSVFGGRVVTVSTCFDPFLRIWDLKTQKTVESIEIDKPGSRGVTYRVRCFHKSKRVVVGGELERLIVFDPAKPKDRVELACPLGVEWLSNHIAISPDDAWVACTADRGQVVCWNMATRKATTVSLIPKTADDADKVSIYSIAFGSSGKLFACRDGGCDKASKGKSEKDVPADRWGVVRIDLPEGKVVPLVLGQNVDTFSCAIDPSGSWLATAGRSRPDKPRRDGVTGVAELRVYNLASKELVYREQMEGLPLNWVAFTPNGKRIVCATINGLVRWWDVTAR